MKNIQIVQTRPEITNGWVVKADTKRFGENEIMFEGSYEECWKYIKGIADMIGWKSVSVIVNGKRDAVTLWRISVIYDLTDIFPKFFFPNFIQGSDIEQLHELIDEYARDRGNEYIDFHDVIWDKDVAPLIDRLRKAGIQRFTFSSTWSSAVETAWLFIQNGCKLEGLVQINGTCQAFMSEEYERVPAYVFSIT